MPARKTFCEEVPSVSVSSLAKRGLLNAAGVIHARQYSRPTRQLFANGWGAHVTLGFLHGSKAEPQAINLDYTPITYGGQRPWFLCPTCNRRCVILYHAGAFACRICLGLVYQVHYLCPEEKTQKRIGRLRRKLGADEFSDSPVPERKKYRHHAVHEKLLSDLDAEEFRYLVEFAKGIRW